MKATVKTKIGKVEYTFEFEEETEIDIIHKVAVLGNPPSDCDCCENSTEFELASNKDKEGNIYVNVVCQLCGAKAKLGRYKGSGYFWHNFEKWEGKKNS